MGYDYASVLNFQIVITSIRRYEFENCIFFNLVLSLTSRQLIYSIQVNKVPSLLLYSLGQAHTKHFGHQGLMRTTSPIY